MAGSASMPSFVLDAVNAASSVAEDAASRSRRPKRRAGRRLLLKLWTTLVFLFSHGVEAGTTFCMTAWTTLLLAHLLLFSLWQKLGLLVSDCAQQVLQHLGELGLLIFRRLLCILVPQKALRLISVCGRNFLQQLGLVRSRAKNVFRQVEDLRYFASICAKGVLRLLEPLRILISVCVKNVLQPFGLVRSLISVRAEKVYRQLEDLRYSVSICAMRVLRQLEGLRILESVCVKNVLQHKLEELCMCAKNVLGLHCVLSLLTIVCDIREVLQQSWLLRGIRSICGEKAKCFLLCYIGVQPKRDDTHPPEIKGVVILEEIDILPKDMKGVILGLLDHEDVFQLRRLSRGWKALIDEIIPSSVLTACYCFVMNGVLQLAGFDPIWRSNTSSGNWRKLPPATYLPADCEFNSDAPAGKQFLICAKSGLVCVNFSKSPLPERLIVFNPVAQSWKELPPLLNRRNPVLMHMMVDEATQSYQILVAGSSWDDQEQHPSSWFTDPYVPRMDQQEHLSKITELYDSRTGQWARVGDLPGPAYALSEFQAGVFQNDNILCIGFMKHNNEVVKGILGFNMVERTWSTYLGLPHSSILQLVENDGQLYVFTERIEDFGEFDDHCVDRVEWTPLDGDIPFKLVNVFRTPKIGGWSLDVFPEYALLPYSKSRLCIFNTVDRTGEIYDVADRGRFEILQAVPEEGFTGEVSLVTLNPMTFTLEPRFNTKV